MKNLLIILLMFTIGFTASAKPGKIKYGKFLVYEGEVTDKQPSGNGVLTATNPDNKKENVFKIEGVFNGTNISNPTITSQGFMPNMEVKGNVQIEVIGKIGKVESFSLLLNNIQVVSKVQDKEATSHGKEITLYKMTLRIGSEDSKWGVSYEGGNGEAKGTFDNIHSVIGNDQRKYGDSELYGRQDVDNIPKVLSLLGYKPNKEQLALHIEKDRFIIDDSYFDLGNNVYVFYNNFFVNTTNKKNIFGVEGNDWIGTREFANGTTVKKAQEGDHVVINYSNQKKYEGTIMGDVLSLIKADCDINNVKFKEGYLYGKENVAVRYLFGEPYDSLHKRLQSEMSEELVADVESGKLTEADAITKYQEKIRQEEEAQQAKANEESLRKMLNNHWNADAVAFEGTITSTKEGADAWRAYFGINPAYFTGKAMLVLDCYGVSAFVFVPEPSKSAANGGRGRVLQVKNFCQKLTNVVEKGDYRIEEHILYIDDKKFGTFSSDWKTFTHEEQGMLQSVMKVSKKEHISADGKTHTFSSK
ncbi:MAG: hypothetical protein PUF55_02855 [Bacteroidales bacterium]|nr:hypothetical protein [Bacteroidales bacterium]